MEFEEMLEVEKKKETVKAQVPSVRVEVQTGLKQFETRAVMADLSVMEKNCKILISQANALTIQTVDERTDATNISGDLQELTKQVKTKCETYLAPYKKVSSVVNGAKKRITEAATIAKKILNQKIFQFQKQEEINQAKQQKIINEQSAIAQELLNAQAKELKIKAPTVAPIKAPKPASIIRGDSGASVYARKGWKCAIITPEDVERKYCLPSKELLNQAVKMGVRKLAGCRVYQDETPVTRSG